MEVPQPPMTPHSATGFKREGWWVVTPRSETIDYDTASEFRREALLAIELGERLLAINMAHVRLVDSMGLGAFVLLKKKVGFRGAIRLFHVSQDLKSFFAMTKTSHIFPIFESLEDILKTPP